VIEVEAGPDDIPVFVRAGAVLALLPDDVGSLSPYAPPLPDRRHVLVIPPGEEQPGEEEQLGPGLTGRTAWTADGEARWTLELTADRDFSWEVTAPMPGGPGEVDSAGPWSFAAGIFRCSVSGASALVRARRFASEPE
jgi:hypothetical protein